MLYEAITPHAGGAGAGVTTNGVGTGGLRTAPGKAIWALRSHLLVKITFIDVFNFHPSGQANKRRVCPRCFKSIVDMKAPHFSQAVSQWLAVFYVNISGQPFIVFIDNVDAVLLVVIALLEVHGVLSFDGHSRQLLVHAAQLFNEFEPRSANTLVTVIQTPAESIVTTHHIVTMIHTWSLTTTDIFTAWEQSSCPRFPCLGLYLSAFSAVSNQPTFALARVGRLVLTWDTGCSSHTVARALIFWTPKIRFAGSDGFSPHLSSLQTAAGVSCPTTQSHAGTFKSHFSI
mmetsp:Transcript_27936/g.35017  ORF Transcript_27936/g.35017 Transcript_27936/m.35017 type:complete len:287 (-) Transcript_27936:508-1368(-)